MAQERKENAYAYSYHSNYIRNARAIAIAWGIFTFCFAIIMIILFVEPSWMYASTQSLGSFGLWQYCQQASTTFAASCESSVFGDSTTEYPKAGLIKAAVYLILVAVISVGLSILCMLLFLCKRPKTPTVFIIAGSLQILSGVLVFFGVIFFSVGKGNLSSIEAKSACGENGSNCQYGWAFILAIIAVLDGIALGILAFILAIKQDKLEADMTYSDYSRPNGSTAGRDYGTVNSSIFKSHSRTSLNSKRNGSISDSQRSVGSGKSETEFGLDAAARGEDPDPHYAQVTPKSQRKSMEDSSSVGNQSTRSRGTPKSSRRSNSPHDVVL